MKFFNLTMKDKYLIEDEERDVCGSEENLYRKGSSVCQGSA
jgi:hypothetical protein